MRIGPTSLRFEIATKPTSQSFAAFGSLDYAFHRFLHMPAKVTALAASASITVCVPQMRMTSSPTPELVAAPTLLSTYNPAPMIGESPTRPCILNAIPLVVHAPERVAGRIDAIVPIVVDSRSHQEECEGGSIVPTDRFAVLDIYDGLYSDSLAIASRLFPRRARVWRAHSFKTVIDRELQCTIAREERRVWYFPSICATEIGCLMC